MRLSYTLTLVATLATGLLLAASAHAQTNLAYCSQTKDGSLECIYATLAACEQTARSESATCIPNPAGRRP